MGKKTKKNRFNQEIDVGIVYTSNTTSDMDPGDSSVELHLSREKVEELQKIRAQLPFLTSTTPVDAELAKLPTEKPFRAFVHNVAFSATEHDVAAFFEPLNVTNINMVSSEGGCRGFCFVDFATRDDLAKALELTDSHLAGRPVTVRIASPNYNERHGGGFGERRERYGFAGGRRGASNYQDSFDRHRSTGYRPAVLRDEMGESDNSGGQDSWRRGALVSRSTDVASASQPAFQRNPQSYVPPHRMAAGEVPTERPRLKLAARSTPAQPEESTFERNAKIFGAAKPVDTASKDRELEERLARMGPIAHPTPLPTAHIQSKHPDDELKKKPAVTVSVAEVTGGTSGIRAPKPEGHI